MKERIKKKIVEAEELKKEALEKSKGGDLAYELSVNSIEGHIDELNQIGLIDDDRPIYEIIDFRLKATSLNTGAVPLSLIAKASDDIRSMIGYAALRLTQGGIDRKRVPKDLYEELDLRLAGILPGSSRLIVEGSANRDLFDDGLNKGALERIFSVLDTYGEGEQFLEAITDLGPASAKKLREFLKVLINHAAEAEFTWKYSGKEVRKWCGSKESIKNVASALEVTEIIEQEKITLIGKIELLSKRERLDLRTQEGRLIKVLFPKILLAKVSELHLNQEVTVQCQITETENPLTSESSIFYELISITG
jgi:hypothetical protein